MYLADGGIIYFGNDQEVTLTHNADKGLLLKHTATADDKPVSLILQTGETDMAANDIIGSIEWQAPDEGTGTDAILVSAAIKAYAEGDHSSSSNATTLGFYTGASEAAAIKMSLSSAGALDVTGDITGSTLNADGDTAAGDNAAIGYTAGEGLILTGQGSTDDITIKNDADTTVVNVATGATDVEISAGNILFGTGSKGVYLGVTSATAANLLDDWRRHCNGLHRRHHPLAKSHPTVCDFPPRRCRGGAGRALRRCDVKCPGGDNHRQITAPRARWACGRRVSATTGVSAASILRRRPS